MIYYIYTLKHPITNEVRYVGKTINIKRRYKQHLYDKRNSHKACWVKSLNNTGLRPVMTIIEECTQVNWVERERYWISQFTNLTNHLDGGGIDYVRTTKEETRKKISLIHKDKPLSETHKANIKKAMNNKPCIIEGIKYLSVADAARALNKPNSTIHSRITSINYPNYVWL